MLKLTHIGLLGSILLLIPCIAGGQYVGSHPFNPSSVRFGVVNGQIPFGKTAGMGHLEYAVTDSLRSVFVNPARYNSSKSRFFTSPYARVLNINSTGSSNFYDSYSEINRGVFIPVGGIVYSDNFYIGGYFSYANYYHEIEYSNNRTNVSTRVRFSRTGFSGIPAALITGFRLDEYVTLGLSYNRSKLSYYRYGESLRGDSRKQIYQRDDGLKLGLTVNKERYEFAAMIGLYQNIFDRNNPWTSRFVERDQGLFMQLEYYQTFSNDLKLSSRLSFSTEKHQTAYDINNFNYYYTNDGYTTNYSFGLGASKQLNDFLLGVELEYEPTDFSNEDGHIEYSAGRWNIRSGIELPLNEAISAQFGFVHSILKIENPTPPTVISGSTIINRIDEPFDKMNLIRLTTGFTYTFKDILLRYQFNYTSYPGELARTSYLNNSLYEPLFNQLTLQYQF